MAYSPLPLNAEGRVQVSTLAGQESAVIGTVSAVAEQVAMDVSRTSNVTMQAYHASAFSGINCTFEASLNSTNGVDGNWFGIQAVRTNANTIEATTGALSATPIYAWEMSVNGYNWLRVRCTARTTGSLTWKIQPAPFATEPIPAIQISGTQPISGTVTITHPTPTALNFNSAATTNATAVKTSAGTLYSISAWNNGGAAAFIKLYNKASAPVPGTDVPVLVIPIAAAGLAEINLGVVGHRFTTGIAMAVTNLAADLDATAIAANQVKVLIAYI